MRCEDLAKANQKLEAQLKLSDEQIEKRDVEILRLASYTKAAKTTTSSLCSTTKIKTKK